MSSVSQNLHDHQAPLGWAVFLRLNGQKIEKSGNKEIKTRQRIGEVEYFQTGTESNMESWQMVDLEVCMSESVSVYLYVHVFLEEKV